MSDVLLEVRDLKTYFPLHEGTVRAVDGVSFRIQRGKTLGVVGESGCGKSVTAQSILRIVPPPGKIVSGQILFHRRPRVSNNGKGGDGKATDDVLDLTQLDAYGSQIRDIRGNEISYIFQEPMASLSPVHTIGHQIVETIVLHQRVKREEAQRRAIE